MPGRKYGMKKKKVVKKPKKHSVVKKVVKPKDVHNMQKAMKFVNAVQKAMKAYGKK